MIEKDMQVKELFDLKHMNDDIESGFDYEDGLLRTTFSNVMFKNDMTNTFLNKLKSLFIYSIESNLVARNWFNYTCHKFYSKHNN